MVDNAIEDHLCPGGSSPKLFQDNGCHSSVQGLEVVSIALSTGTALGLFFSQQFLGDCQVGGHVAKCHRMS